MLAAVPPESPNVAVIACVSCCSQQTPGKQEQTLFLLYTIYTICLHIMSDTAELNTCLDTST